MDLPGEFEVHLLKDVKGGPYGKEADGKKESRNWAITKTIIGSFDPGGTSLYGHLGVDLFQR
jgi:hypothetical protein